MRSKSDKLARLEFIGYWANYVRTHSDRDWSTQQAALIDSMLDGARELSKPHFAAQKKLVLAKRMRS